MIPEQGTPFEPGSIRSLERYQKLNSIYKINKGTFLEIGCGFGAFTELLRKNSELTFGFDINSEFIQKAKRMVNSDKLIVADSQNIPFKDNLFDSVFIIETFEHLINKKNTVFEIKRILKKDSALYISVPNKYFPIETHSIKILNKKIDGRYIPFLSMFDLIHNRIGTADRFSLRKLIKLFPPSDFTLIGYDYLMPSYESNLILKNIMKPVSIIFEKTFLKIFSLTLLAVFKVKK